MLSRRLREIITSYAAEGGGVNDGDLNVYADPAEVVRRFIADMHAWEVQTAASHRAARKSGLESPWEVTRTLLAQVFERWCTPKDRKQGRLGSFSTPPEYQPEHEPVLETSYKTASRACVYTQQRTGFKNKRRYVLLKKSDRWLIDNVKWHTHGGKWEKGSL